MRDFLRGVRDAFVLVFAVVGFYWTLFNILVPAAQGFCK